MVPIPALWLPILLGAALVFVASSVIHMFLGYHKSDWKKLPDEDGVMEALRPFAIPAGDYTIPYVESAESMKSEEFQAKVAQGPVALMTVLPSGHPSGMGKQLVLWFVYCIVVSVFAAYIAGRALGMGAAYLEVFRFAGCTAFAAYGLAHLQRSIWYSQGWGTTGRNVLDALIYGLLTAGVFGWLWPG